MALDDKEPGIDEAEPAASASAVERTYDVIHEMAMAFRLRPGERLNESELSRELGISRTPLREALNRLVAENLLEFVPSKGFFRRNIQPREMFELYQLRLSLETLALDLLMQRLTPAALAELHDMAVADLENAGATMHQAVQTDECFHETLAALSGNGELLTHLRAINLRIRPVRHFGMNRNRIRDGVHMHFRIVEAIGAQDKALATRLLAEHITCHLDEVESDVRQLYGQIYVG